MQTRREQVRAYRFINRRMVSALVSGDPEDLHLPMRRLGLTIFASTMIATIVVAVVAVYGLYNPGGGRLEPNSLVIERETGARFVYLDGRLYPVLNFTSARLILGQPDPPQQTVSQATLRDLPRGRTLGIRDAPDALPNARSLVGLPWSICGTQKVTRQITHLAIGGALAGGHSLGDDALLVEAAGAQHLIWHNRRLQVGGPGVLAALELSYAQPVPVGEALLNSITAGPDLAAPTIDGKGTPSGQRIAGRAARIGTVYRAGNEHYVLLRTGLALINPITARLLLADGKQPQTISPNEAGRLRTDSPLESSEFLDKIPRVIRLDPARASICGTLRETHPGGANGATTNGLGTTVEYFETAPARLTGPEASGEGSPQRAVRAVDQVIVDGGRGTVVRTLPAMGASPEGSTVYLITDEGVKYALRTERDVDAKAVLGYANVTPVLVPAALLALVPTGPSLDASGAARFVGTTSADGQGSGNASPSGDVVGID